MSPARKIIFFFIAAILAGGILLSAPFTRRAKAPPAGAGQTVMTGVFTAASAVCVTGLSVVNINEYFNLFGQFVILLLIQLGALGYVTFATASGMLFGKLQIRERLAIKEVVDPYTFDGLLALLKRIIKIAVAVELAGAAVLSALFLKYFTPAKAVGCGIFHSVSAFANAGFSIFPTSFETFSGDYAVMMVISALILAGGIGFLVLVELSGIYGKRGLTLHAKMALIISGILVAAGMAAVLIFENANPATLGARGPAGKIANAFFMSVTARTAGFNTLKVAALMPPTLFFTMILMFIGASPGGTGGGVKTTTFGAVALWVVAFIRGKDEVNVFARKIPREVVHKAVTYMSLGAGIVTASYLSFALFEKSFSPSASFFEVVSAFGTVGLSTGITPLLGPAARVILIMTMLAGRIGPLTLALSVVGKRERDLIQYPEERMLIG